MADYAISSMQGYSWVSVDECTPIPGPDGIGSAIDMFDPNIELEEFYEMIADNMPYHLARHYKFYAEYEKMEQADDFPLIGA